MRLAAWLSVLAVAAALAGASYMLVAPFYRGLSCESVPFSGERECTETSSTLLEHEDDAHVLTLAAVPVLLTAGTMALTFAAPRLRVARWLPAGVLLFLCLLSGFTIGIFFLPSALLLIFSVGIDEARASEDKRTHQTVPPGR